MTRLELLAGSFGNPHADDMFVGACVGFLIGVVVMWTLWAHTVDAQCRCGHEIPKNKFGDPLPPPDMVGHDIPAERFHNLSTVQIDDTPLDTLTVKLWRDQPGPLYQGTEAPGWCCHTGEDPVEGAMGCGATPLAALRDLCDGIARDEGVWADNRKLRLR